MISNIPNFEAYKRVFWNFFADFKIINTLHIDKKNISDSRSKMNTRYTKNIF